MSGDVARVQKETIPTSAKSTAYIQPVGKGSTDERTELSERLRADGRKSLAEVYVRNEQRLSRQGVEISIIGSLNGLAQKLCQDIEIKGGVATKHPSSQLLKSIAAASVAFDQIVYLISNSGHAYELAEYTDAEIEKIASRCREFERRCLE